MDRGLGGCRGSDGSGEFGGIQVSSDFTANVTTIANSDTDVQNLINQGYNITSIRPVITNTVDGNGNIVTKASTADLTLQGTVGRAFVVVDLKSRKGNKDCNDNYDRNRQININSPNFQLLYFFSFLIFLYLVFINNLRIRAKFG